MCKIVIDNAECDESNYNFIISNIVLSQTKQFTYRSILEEIKQVFGSITTIIEDTLKSCLIRLRDDGFLWVLGSYYMVEI